MLHSSRENPAACDIHKAPGGCTVQWASFGTKPPEDTILFATRLAQAALAAVTFEYNGYVVDYGGGDQ